MSYYRNEFDKRGFNTMFTFLKMGHQKANIPEYNKAIENLIIMMNQKTSGKSNKDINWDEEFDMTIITIVCESISLYLSGDLEKIEKGENKIMRSINKNIDEETINKIIENFNEDFETNIKCKETDFLIKLYNTFIDTYSTSTVDEDIANNLSDIEMEINSKFSQEDKNLFEKWNDANDELINDITNQAFVYGWCCCKQLNT